MVKCANCSNDALYVYQVTESFGINYCQYHLPRFLHDQRNGGLLAAPVQSEPELPVVEEAPKTKKKAVAEETPVVDEVPLEETPAGK